MFVLVLILSLAVDFATKYFVSTGMELGESIPVLGNILSWTYVRNYGAAYNILDGKGDLLIILTSIMMIGLLIYYIIKRKELTKLETLSFALLIGGGAGNLFSRIFAGYVVDFIDIRIIPVFNAADICICCGAALLVVCEFFTVKKGEEGK